MPLFGVSYFANDITAAGPNGVIVSPDGGTHQAVFRYNTGVGVFQIGSTSGHIVRQIANGANYMVTDATGANVGVYGAAAVARAGAITPPSTTGSTQTTPFGFGTAAQADNLTSAVKAMQVALQNFGITA